MKQSLLVVFLGLLIGCSYSNSKEESYAAESEKDLSEVLVIQTAYDTINKDDGIEFVLFIGDTSLIDLSEGYPQSSIFCALLFTGYNSLLSSFIS